MKIGTRSILFGYHQFLLHPLVLFIAWWRLYGFPSDPRLWLAFLVHDLGYWGKPNMDGQEGEQHPEFGAAVMHFLFDKPKRIACRAFYYSDAEAYLAKGWRIATREEERYSTPLVVWLELVERPTQWRDLCLYHSRFYAKAAGAEPSRLCAADKYAIVICPTWLQLLLMNLTGEIKEYMSGRPGRTDARGMTQRQFVSTMKGVCRSWVDTYEQQRQNPQPKTATH